MMMSRKRKIWFTAVYLKWIWIWWRRVNLNHLLDVKTFLSHHLTLIYHWKLNETFLWHIQQTLHLIQIHLSEFGNKFSFLFVHHCMISFSCNSCRRSKDSKDSLKYECLSSKLDSADNLSIKFYMENVVWCEIDKLGTFLICLSFCNLLVKISITYKYLKTKKKLEMDKKL